MVGGKMNPRIRLISAKVEVGVEVEAELGNNKKIDRKVLYQKKCMNPRNMYLQ